MLFRSVEHPEHKKRLWELMGLYSDSRVRRWEMQNDGEWIRINGDDSVDLQEYLIEVHRGSR